MPAHAVPIPPPVVARLRAICSGLPETREERAWVGMRWCVRKKNFAHILVIDQGWPPAYAKAAGSEGPVCVLTFRLPVQTLDAPRFTRPPFFRPPWWPNIAGMALQADTDWDEVESLVTESYCVLAPSRLAALVRAS